MFCDVSRYGDDGFARAVGVDDYQVVFTLAEYKKTRPRYFEAEPLCHVRSDVPLQLDPAPSPP